MISAIQNANVPLGPEAARKATSPEEAAEQFEEVLVRQFVKEMTKDLFKSSLAGEDGPGWMASQADSQRDHFTDMLTKHLVDSDALDVSSHLLRQWNRAGLTTPDAAPATAPISLSDPTAPIDLTVEPAATPLRHDDAR